MMTLRAGSLFAKSYEIVRPISAGGMGVVYEVIHLGTKRRRALKIMLPHIVSDPTMRDRFALETIVTAEIESEHLTEVFDAGIDPETDCPFLAMELLRGEDLGARLKRGERFSAEETLIVAEQVALALEKTHARGIVHRDLKPDNLFLTTRDDGSPRIKILDFGIAKIVKESGSGPNTTKSFGTPLYMAREQITGEAKLIGPAADTYAVAQIVFSLLTGAPYFQEEVDQNAGNILAVLLAVGKGPKEPATLRAARRSVGLPAAFDAWFAKATAAVPAERFTSVRALVDALRSVLREPVVARPGPDASTLPSSPEAHVGSAVPTPDVPVRPLVTPTVGATSQRVEPSFPPPPLAPVSATLRMGEAPPLLGGPAASQQANDTGSAQPIQLGAAPRSRAPWFAVVVAVLLGLGVAGWAFTRGRTSSAPAASAAATGTTKEPVAPTEPTASQPSVSIVANSALASAASASPAVASALASTPALAGAGSASAAPSSRPSSGNLPAANAKPSSAPTGAVWETR